MSGCLASSEKTVDQGIRAKASIGANDLCSELGIPGQFANPRLRTHIAKVAQACNHHGKLLMVGGISDLDIIQGLVPLGIAPLFFTGTDTDMLYSAAEQRSRRISEWHRQNYGE